MLENNRYGLVYKTTNTLNNKIYIGQTTFTVKFLENDYFGSGTLIRKALIRYGKTNFKKEVLHYASSQEELNLLEINCIEAFKSLNPIGYNLRTGGTQGGHLTNSSKTLISKTKKGKTLFKDCKGTVYYTSVDDPRVISGELVGRNKGLKHSEEDKVLKFATSRSTFVVVDRDGNKFRTKRTDPRYISGELVSIAKGMVSVRDLSTGKTRKVTKSSLVSLGTAVAGVTVGMISARDPKTGETFKVLKTDPRWLAGELVGTAKKNWRLREDKLEADSLAELQKF